MERQFAHTGELVRFDMVLTRGYFQKTPLDPFGIVDYCIVNIGSEQIEANLDERGHFGFSHEIGPRDGVTLPITATAYRSQGLRDRMKIGGRWINADDPYDPTDTLVATAGMELFIYKTSVDWQLKHTGNQLKMETGRLEILKEDAPARSIYHKSRTPGGFDASASTETEYRVLYEPTWDEINRSGTTPIRFLVYDTNDIQHEFLAAISTP